MRRRSACPTHGDRRAAGVPSTKPARINVDHHPPIASACRTRQRRQRRVVAHRIRHIVGACGAEHRERAREYEPRRLRQCTQRFEQMPCRIENDPDPEIELRFGLAADDRREMEHRLRVVPDQRAHGERIGDVAGDELDARIVEAAPRRRRTVRGRCAARRRRRSAFRAPGFFAQDGAQKTGAPGDDDSHCSSVVIL